ncbi:MAG: hypothetical protein ACEPOZ_15145 [Marinifilaceae bacterium]
MRVGAFYYSNKMGNTDVLSQKKTLQGDGTPVYLGKFQDSAIINQTTDGYMALLIQNVVADSKVKYSISSGGNEEEHEINQGVLAPVLLIKNWQANNLKIVNIGRIEDDYRGDIMVRLYNLSGQSKYHFPPTQGGEVTLQYAQSVSGQSSSGTMQLRLSAFASNVSCAVVNSGIETPKGYALNVNNDDKEYYKSQGFDETSNTNQIDIKGRWHGNSVFILNASETKENEVKVNLTPL